MEHLGLDPNVCTLDRLAEYSKYQDILETTARWRFFARANAHLQLFVMEQSSVYVVESPERPAPKFRNFDEVDTQ